MHVKHTTLCNALFSYIFVLTSYLLPPGLVDVNWLLDLFFWDIIKLSISQMGNKGPSTIFLFHLYIFCKHFLHSTNFYKNTFTMLFNKFLSTPRSPPLGYVTVQAKEKGVNHSRDVCFNHTLVVRYPSFRVIVEWEIEIVF